MQMTLQLSGWNSIPHVSSHVASSLKSSCSWRQSWIDMTVWYMMQSSAKSQVLEVTVSGRSLINIKKSNRPRMVPWGTPITTCTLSEVARSTMTCWFLSFRNDRIQLYVGPLIRSDVSLPAAQDGGRGQMLQKNQEWSYQSVFFCLWPLQADEKGHQLCFTAAACSESMLAVSKYIDMIQVYQFFMALT